MEYDVYLAQIFRWCQAAGRMDRCAPFVPEKGQAEAKPKPDPWFLLVLFIGGFHGKTIGKP